MGHNILINGRGRYHNDSFHENSLYKNYWNGSRNPFDTNLLTRMPRATFFVTSQKRYRFRLMSPGFTITPIRMSIDNHMLQLIATDSAPVVPKPVKSIVIFPGER